MIDSEKNSFKRTRPESFRKNIKTNVEQISRDLDNAIQSAKELLLYLENNPYISNASLIKDILYVIDKSHVVQFNLNNSCKILVKNYHINEFGDTYTSYDKGLYYSIFIISFIIDNDLNKFKFSLKKEIYIYLSQFNFFNNNFNSFSSHLWRMRTKKLIDWDNGTRNDTMSIKLHLEFFKSYKEYFEDFDKIKHPMPFALHIPEIIENIRSFGRSKSKSPLL